MRRVEVQCGTAQGRDVDIESLGDRTAACDLIGSFHRSHRSNTIVENFDAHVDITATDKGGKGRSFKAKVEVFEREYQDIIEIPVVDVVAATIEEDAELHTDPRRGW